MNNSVIILLIVIVAIALFAWLFKSFAKMILLLGLIYVIFHIGFLWNTEDIQNKLNFFKFIKPEYREQAMTGYDDFAKKRDEYGVIDTEAVEQAIDDAIGIAVSKAKGEFDKIDKEKLLNDLNTKLQNFDPQTVADTLQKLKDELSQYVTEEELEGLGDGLEASPTSMLN